MLSHRQTPLIAFALGLALVFPAPALAQPPFPPPSAAGLDTAPDDPGLAPDAAAGDPALDEPPPSAPAPPPGHHPTGTAGQFSDWVTAANDNGDQPFMIVDKLAARVFAFDADGRFLGSAPVLIGLARGDDSAPGIGNLKLSAIGPDERTTPAGRFEAQFGGSDGHGTVLWVDYADAISMHPVMSVSPNEHRLRRIKSAAPGDHRISYGCINVPAKFYEDVVLNAFAGGSGVVYILPDTKPLQEVFPAFAAALGVGAEQLSQQARRADRLGDAPDRIPDPQPSQLNPVDDRLWMQPLADGR
jgi:hypothetical protein